MLKEEEIRTFIEGTTNYFETSAQQAASVGSPYLVTDGNPGAYEYTGVIGISGARKGIVYFTAPRGMLTVLLMRISNASMWFPRRHRYGDALRMRQDIGHQRTSTRARSSCLLRLDFSLC